MRNPCLSPAVKNLFQKPKTTHWTIFDKDTIDEAIFRTLNIRNRLMLERVSGMEWNQCPDSRGIGVRFALEYSVSRSS
jgi:hypothetical protein